MDSKISSLKELTRLRSAPVLDQFQIKKLKTELYTFVEDADWFTVGIMANSIESSILAIRELEGFFSWKAMKILIEPNADGPVFLKANQKSGNIYIRVEHGLGNGILLTCQKDNNEEPSITIGPLPLDFFKDNIK